MAFKLSLKSLVTVAFATLLAASSSPAAAATVTVSARVNGVCGNNILEIGEQCDGTDLGGNTCETLGYSGGTLSCNSNCTLNTSACTNPPPSSGGGGGGGGGGYFPNVVTSAVFAGYAFPGTQVTLLKDSQVAASAAVGNSGTFQISVSNLSSGNYFFSLYDTDTYGNRSALVAFPVSITGGATTYVSGVFISPTLTTDKSTVKQGDTITFFGQSVPNAAISISVNSNSADTLTTTADATGAYLKEFDTSLLDFGQHTAYAKASADNLVSESGNVIAFTVGTTDIKRQTAAAKADLNGDNRVNIVDFSIMAYWYGKKNPPANIDIGGFGVVDLRDFSILAYYWTG